MEYQKIIKVYNKIVQKQLKMRFMNKKQKIIDNLRSIITVP